MTTATRTLVLDRAGSITFIADHPRMLIGVPLARKIASEIGVAFDMLLYVEPTLVRRPQHGDLVAAGITDVVQVSELGAALCRYMDLYASRDHSLQAPHGTLGKIADYVGQRAAIRLARATGGEAAVRDLYRDVPRIPKVLRQERVYKP